MAGNCFSRLRSFGMIFCIFTSLAAFGAGDIEIVPRIIAAVFEGDLVLHDVIVAWPQLSLALTATTAAF